MTASRTDTGVALSFSGRFKFGIDQWAYVPFAYRRASTGSTSARRTISSRCSESAATCWTSASSGLRATRWQLRGFRGWSGGARAGFMMSAVNATPGYLAGPSNRGDGQWRSGRL